MFKSCWAFHIYNKRCQLKIKKGSFLELLLYKYTLFYQTCVTLGPCLPGCFFQLHWVHWSAPYCCSPGSPADSVWTSIWETSASLPAGRSNVKKRANHRTGSLLDLPTLPHPLLYLRPHRHLNPQTGGKTRTESLGLPKASAGTRKWGRWRRASLVVRTSSAKWGGGEEGVREAWCTEMLVFTCREAKKTN